MDDSRIATATVMFTDLVGSTELRSRIGEEAADLVRTGHDRTLTIAIESENGRVVKRLGDGVMATFVSATDALRAAVAVQQAIDLGNRRGDGARLSVRIGVSAGDVTFEQDDCFGMAVVEAQRLESAARTDSITCAQVVVQLAQGRGGHVFRSLGRLDLKGLPDPLVVYEVEWERVREVTQRDELLPPVLGGSGLPFAGRDDLFARLLDSWQTCVAGGFETVLLAGEPGVGKTRLAQELARRVRVDAVLSVADTASAALAPTMDVVVLGGRCDEDVAVPFQPFGTALDWFVRHEPVEQLRTSLGEFPGDLVRLVPRLADLVGELPEPLHDEPEAERLRLFHAVESWLSVGGSERPRLLVIDDLQWADTSTLLMLKHLVADQPPGLMVLCAYRDTDVDRAHPLSSTLAGLRQMDRVVRIALGGLAEDGVRELLVRASGHDLDDLGLQFAERVQRETSGNPFFLGEVLRHLIETGDLVERDGQWTSDLGADEAGIPEGIREVVGQRLGRLGDGVDHVLRSAAVIGYEFDVDLLAEVVGRNADDVLDALDAAVRANLVVEVGVDRHRFAHALVRETLHAELSSSRRARQHRKVALALEARHGDNLDEAVPELATHWAEATAGGDPSRAIELAVRAGELASDRGAFENAARWFERAIDLMDDAHGGEHIERRRVLVRLAEAKAVSGSAVEARTDALAAARAAIRADDAATVVDALRVRARHSFSASDPADPERVDVLRSALTMTSMSEWQRAALLGELAKELIFDRDLEARSAVVDEQREMLARLPVRERVLLTATAGATSYSQWDRSVLEHRMSEAVEVLGRHDLPAPDRWRVHGHVAYTAMHLGDRAAMDTAIAGMDSLRAGTGAVRDAMTMLHESMRHTIDGHIADAEAVARELVTRLESLGVPEAAAYASTTTLAVARERGTLFELTPVLDSLEGSGHPAGPERATAAWVRFFAGDLDRVRVALHDLDGHDFADDATYQVCVAYWAEVVAGLRSESHCRQFADRLADKSRTNLLIGGLHLGPVDRLLALLHDALGDRERADLHFAAAVEQQESFASPTWVVRTWLDWASSSLAHGERDRASASLDAALIAMGTLELADSRRRHADLSAQFTATR